jgi:hypothetical protein
MKSAQKSTLWVGFGGRYSLPRRYWVLARGCAEPASFLTYGSCPGGRGRALSRLSGRDVARLRRLPSVAAGPPSGKGWRRRWQSPPSHSGGEPRRRLAAPAGAARAPTRRPRSPLPPVPARRLGARASRSPSRTIAAGPCVLQAITGRPQATACTSASPNASATEGKTSAPAAFTACSTTLTFVGDTS